MAMSVSIFRQHALDHFTAPEPLDQLMRVVRPQHWLALATCAALVGVAVLWGIYGHLPTTVTGRGVLIRPRQVVDVQAPAAGRLATLSVRVGDVIRAGDVLGTIEQVEIRHQLQEARAREETLLAQDRAKQALQTQQTTLQANKPLRTAVSSTCSARTCTNASSDAQAKVPVLHQRFENRTRLETLGLLPRLSDERLQAEQAYLDNQNTIAALQAELKQLDSKRTQLATQSKRQALETPRGSHGPQESAPGTAEPHCPAGGAAGEGERDPQPVHRAGVGTHRAGWPGAPDRAAARLHCGGRCQQSPRRGDLFCPFRPAKKFSPG